MNSRENEIYVYGHKLFLQIVEIVSPCFAKILNFDVMFSTHGSRDRHEQCFQIMSKFHRFVKFLTTT